MLVLKSLASLLFLGITLQCTAPQNVSEANSQTNKKKEASKSAVETFSGNIVRDCTGTYIRIDEKDYQVCNSDILKSRKEGERVTVKYEIAKECPEGDGIAVCMLYHPKEALIRVKSVL